jgi:arsenate reductase
MIYLNIWMFYSLIMKMKASQTNEKVLFLCNQNSARSQMAEGILKSLYGGNFEVYSAGSNPGNVNPYAVKVLEEMGVDDQVIIPKV